MTVATSIQAGQPGIARDAVETPIGRVLIACEDAGVAALSLPGEAEQTFARRLSRLAGRAACSGQAQVHATAIAAELEEYFAGHLRVFTVPLAPHGTPFQHQVWDAVCAVRYGETAAYGTIAARLGRPLSARAVGHANGSNPLPIVIPCHRLLGHDGSLTGYAGGLAMKRWLIDHESTAATRSRSDTRRRQD